MHHNLPNLSRPKHPSFIPLPLSLFLSPLPLPFPLFPLPPRLFQYPLPHPPMLRLNSIPPPCKPIQFPLPLRNSHPSPMIPRSSPAARCRAYIWRNPSSFSASTGSIFFAYSSKIPCIETAIACSFHARASRTSTSAISALTARSSGSSPPSSSPSDSTPTAKSSLPSPSSETTG
ncbi:uncharacterized protein BDW43DRAFT_7905 [Aspergillus alliaceus]|uniref:uncharacterized protein n=1 Tax=Petromyces alliaceus TaxID=209559 RepID=UPI0012A66729|nr:uncharacterized protein BDW43DRAFT_7905 [Aspergillus alliaceus]KAB8239569.1 hypothetical protein BDW43DRAFT_7905 [Aspergillus alliaceus]